MSHFAVMIVTDEEPTAEVLTKLMQPYHEFECTGENDQYIQEIDETEEFRKEWESQKGDYKTEAEFAKEWYGRESIREGETPDMSGQQKFGYVVVNSDGKVLRSINRTNPNAKWDYWRVGGRYRARLQVKQGVSSAVETEPSWEWTFHSDKEREIPEGFDQAKVADLDLDRMKEKAVEQHRKRVDDDLKESGLTFSNYEKAIKEKKVGHAEWMKLPEPRPRGTQHYEWLAENGYTLAAKTSRLWDLPELAEGQSLQEWIDAAPALSSFAVLKDGKWYQRGEMGWWGCVSDENDDWDSEFGKLVESLRDDQWLSFLDCHI